MNGPLYKNTDSGGGMAATGSFCSCLAAPRPGGEEGREHPLKGQWWVTAPPRSRRGWAVSPLSGEKGGHPAIQPFVPQPQAQGTAAASSSRELGGSAACRPGGSRQVPSTGLYTSGFLTPPGGASRSLRGLGLAILRRPQAFWTILNDT